MLISTAVGAVDVLVQASDTVLVRSGSHLPNHGKREEIEALEAARKPLELGRGIVADVHAHFTLTYEGTRPVWRPHRGYTSLRRLDRGGDVPPAATTKAWEAIGEAIGEYITAEHRDDAQREKNLEKAKSLHAQAAGLTRMVDQLNRQASELETDPSDARYVYLEQRLRSGYCQRASAVRTAAGEFLFVDEPRDMVHDSQTRRYHDESAPWTKDKR